VNEPLRPNRKRIVALRHHLGLAPVKNRRSPAEPNLPKHPENLPHLAGRNP